MIILSPEITILPHDWVGPNDEVTYGEKKRTSHSR